MESLNEVYGKLAERFSVERLLATTVVAIVYYLVCRFVLNLLKKALEKSSFLKGHELQVLKAVKVLMIFFAIFLLGKELGLDTSAVLALFSVLSLGIALAAETVLANMAGGIVILSHKPFKVGDIVMIGDTTGYVREIRIYYTKIATFNGEIVMIPNKDVSSTKVMNISETGKRRLVIPVYASYEDEPSKVIDICLATVKSMDNILGEPEPYCHLASYLDYYIQYDLAFWVPVNQYLGKKYEINERLYTALKENNVEMAHNYLNVHMM